MRAWCCYMMMIVIDVYPQTQSPLPSQLYSANGVAPTFVKVKFMFFVYVHSYTTQCVESKDEHMNLSDRVSSPLSLFHVYRVCFPFFLYFLPLSNLCIPYFIFCSIDFLSIGRLPFPFSLSLCTLSLLLCLTLFLPLN